LDEEGAEVGGAREATAGLAEALEHVDPDRLDDVEGVELGAQLGRQVAANDHAEVRLVGAEHLLTGGVVAGTQLLQEGVEVLGGHVSSSGGGSDSASSP